MLAGKKMIPSKASKQTSSAASKIKNKMLNTSSFFKVSLKTNNKDLAVALAAQKERSRQLVMDTVYLQKQVEALRFELATRRYKHRKLLLILKDLRSSALHHLGLVADLFTSDSDLLEVSDDSNRQSSGIIGVDTNDGNIQMERLTVQLPPQPELSMDEMCPTKQTTMDLPEKNTFTNLFGIQSGPIKSSDTREDGTNEMERHLGQDMQAAPRETPCQTIILRDEVERLSKMFSQSAFDINSAPCLQNNHTPSAVDTSEKSQPCVSGDVHHPSSSGVATELEHDNGQEKTVLLNTMMEMTLSNAIEIVTVETKGKKNGSSGKLKRKKKTQTKDVSVVKEINKDKRNKEHVSGAENPEVRKSAESGLTEIQRAPTVTDHLTEQSFTDTEVTEAPIARSRLHITSRIPKMSKSEACDRQKMVKDIFKSNDSAKSKSKCRNIVLPEWDDYFMDPEIQCSKAKESERFSSEKDIPEARSKTKCRKTSLVSKTDQAVTRKTFVILNDLPSNERDMRTTHSERKSSKTLQHKLDDHHDELEEENKGEYEARQSQQLHEEFLACTDDNVIEESEHVHRPSLSGNKPQSKIQREKTDYRENKRTKCRGTFVISVTRDSSCSVSSDVSAVDQVFIPGTGYSCVAEESPKVMDAIVVRQLSEPNLYSCPATDHSDRDFVEETQSSCKRPWVATQEQAGIPQDLSNNHDHEILSLDHGSATITEFQKPKKSRREETGRISKKKATQREDSVDPLNDKKKRKKKRSHSTQGSRPQDGTYYLKDSSCTSPLHGSVCMDDPVSNLGMFDRRTNEGKENVLQVVDSRSNISEMDEHLIVSKPTNSNPRMDQKPKQLREPSPDSSRHKRETFVVCSRVTQGSISFTNNARTSDTYSHTVDSSGEALRQSLRDLLTDEMPPWETMDVSSADTDLDCLVSSPKRVTSGRVSVFEEPAAITAEAPPAGRVLTSLTNTITTLDNGGVGRTRRRNGAVSYKEPPLNCKMRRGDKFTDTKFLSSPIFKDGRKKKQKKTLDKPNLESSLFVD